MRNIAFVPNERDMIKGIYMGYVCKISIKVPRIKNIEFIPKLAKSFFFIQGLGEDIG
jgi:hypothetical protein